jgi:hypothetical protein
MKRYVNIIIDGESIGSYGKLLNVKPINSDKYKNDFSNVLSNVAFIVLVYVCIKEILFIPS